MALVWLGMGYGAFAWIRQVRVPLASSDVLPTTTAPPARTNAPQGKMAVAPERQSCRVLRVFDGDTFACDLNQNGRLDKPLEYVRLLLIDAPETIHSKRNHDGVDEPFAQAAYTALENAVAKKTVWLEFDKEPIDKYDRHLAYVFLHATDTPAQSVNAQLVRQGLAHMMRREPNIRYERELLAALIEARENRRGFWGAIEAKQPTKSASQTELQREHP